MNRDDQIPYVILACCVLHNLCLDDPNDGFEDFIAEGQRDAANVGGVEFPDNVDGFVEDGLAKRNHLAAALMARQ